VIGMYRSSPKVKCRKGMCGASQLIPELKVQDEIVCQFRRDRVSISPGGDRLRFEKSSPRWRIVGREEIHEMEEDSTEIGRQRSKTMH